MNTHWQHHNRSRGAAMVEAVLVLPFILFILALIIYFGFQMERFQRATMMDRYESWLGATRAPGPSAGLDNRGVNDMNRLFFGGDLADALIHEPTPYFPREPHEYWRNTAGFNNSQAGTLADDYFDTFPRGRSSRFYVRHDTSIPLYDAFEGPLRHRHTRMDTDWRFVNGIRFDSEDGWVPSEPRVTPGDSVREVFYDQFDGRLQVYADENDLAEAIRSFYLNYPGYGGPTVPTEWEIGVGWF
jgi:hypothetical protein